MHDRLDQNAIMNSPSQITELGGLARRRTVGRWRYALSALLLAGGLLVQPSVAPAAIIEPFTFDTFDGNGKLDIPDGNPAGVSDTRTINSAGDQIVSLTLSLDIASEFNGDLYVYLLHENQISILVNRPGRSATDSFGYSDSGLNITLSDSASANLHAYRETTLPVAGLPLTGSWQPDGRAVDPDAVKTSDASTASLSTFKGANPSGEWTLFVADLSSGGTAHLNSWSLQITSVPEPMTTTGVCAAALIAFYGCRRMVRSIRRRRGTADQPCAAREQKVTGLEEPIDA